MAISARRGSAYDEFDWVTAVEKVGAKTYDHDRDWFGQENADDLVRVVEIAQDLDEDLREIEKRRRQFEKFSSEGSYDRVRKRYEYIEDSFDCLRPKIQELTDLLVQYISQAHNDVNSWFSKSSDRRHDVHDEDDPKRRRNYLRNYLNYIRDILIETHIDVVLFDEFPEDPIKHAPIKFAKFVENFERCLHSFLSFLWDWHEDMTYDVTLDKMDPEEAAHEVLVEAAATTQSGAVSVESFKQNMQTKLGRKLTEAELFDALKWTHRNANGQYDAVSVWNALEDDKTVVLEDEYDRVDAQDLYSKYINLSIAADFPRLNNETWDNWEHHNDFDDLRGSMIEEYHSR